MRNQDLAESLINDPDPRRKGKRAFAKAKAQAKGSPAFAKREQARKMARPNSRPR